MALAKTAGLAGDRNSCSSFKRVEVKYQIQSVACGAKHTLCQDSQQRVFSFGLGITGALGLCHLASRQGRRSDKLLPTEVVTLRDRKIFKSVAGGLHSAGLADDGECFTFIGDDGQLGRRVQGGSSKPSAVRFPIVDVKTANAQHCLWGRAHSMSPAIWPCFCMRAERPRSARSGRSCPKACANAPHDACARCRYFCALLWKELHCTHWGGRKCLLHGCYGAWSERSWSPGKKEQT